MVSLDEKPCVPCLHVPSFLLLFNLQVTNNCVGSGREDKGTSFSVIGTSGMLPHPIPFRGRGQLISQILLQSLSLKRNLTHDLIPRPCSPNTAWEQETLLTNPAIAFTFLTPKCCSQVALCSIFSLVPRLLCGGRERRTRTWE